jgi:hypothetical protein
LRVEAYEMHGAIDVWQEDGGWRWAYEEDGLRIVSNHPYATRQEAVVAAATAYPDARIEPPTQGTELDHAKRPTLISFVLMVVALWRWYRRARAS